jgi:acetoin utilization protein AcuB
MTTEMFIVSPRTPVRKAAHEMARRRIGSVVVVDGGRVVGVFTTVDALHALAAVLAPSRSAPH